MTIVWLATVAEEILMFGKRDYDKPLFIFKCIILDALKKR